MSEIIKFFIKFFYFCSVNMKRGDPEDDKSLSDLKNP